MKDSKKTLFTSFGIKRKFFDLHKRHNNNVLDFPNKNFVFNNYTVDIFLFVTAIISLVVTTIVMYILCKHMILKSLVTSVALQQIKEVSVVAKQQPVSIEQDVKCTCKIQWYTILMLSLSMLGLVFFVILIPGN